MTEDQLHPNVSAASADESATDAQPTRSARRLPYRRRLISSGFGVLLAAALCVGSLANLGVEAVVVAAGLVLVVGWPQLLRVPNIHSARVSMLLGLVALALILFTQKYSALPFVAALGVGVVFVVEMFRKADALRRMEQMSGAYLGILVILGLALFAAAFRASVAGSAVAMCLLGASAVVAVICTFLQRSTFIVGLLNSLVTGIALAYVFELQLWAGAVLGLCALVAYFLTCNTFSTVTGTEQVGVKQLYPLLAYSALPIASLGFLAYLFAVLLG